jgi:hypothetical protein
MIKNIILKLPEIQKNPEYSNITLNNDEVIYSFIEKLPTIQKIFIVQNLLKEMISIKNLFIDNKKNMIKKIDLNSYKYFENIIKIKQVIDYCESNNPEIILYYNLLKDQNAEEALHNFEEDEKNFISNFFIELRNDTSLMLKIIEEIEPSYYNQLSFFVTHFLYEHTTDSDLKQDELMVILYLVMHNTINDKFPELITHRFLLNLDEKQNELFLYHFIKSFVLKPEIRNYLITIMHDLILNLEKENKKISINTSILLDDLILENNENNNINEINDLRRKSMTKSKKEKNVEINNNDDDSLVGKVRTKTVFSHSMNFAFMNKLKNKNIELNEIKESDNIDDNNNHNDINSFFENNNFLRLELSKNLSKLNNKNEERTNIEEAFMEFLFFIKDEYQKEKNTEIYSSHVVLSTFNNLKRGDKINLLTKEQNFDDIYINNFMIITNFVKNLFTKIEENMNLIPYTIKYIYYYFDKLITKKYVEKGSITYYKILILKLKFFFDEFIIPILENPISNGCISDGVVSDITIKNLKIITTLIEKFFSGNLFKIFNDKTDPFYTIFNVFIINEIQNLFELGEKLDNYIKNNFEPSKAITNIIELIEKNNYENYNFFLYNKEENIRYQSVCFSYEDLIMIINTVEKDVFKNYFASKKSKNDYELIKKYKKIFNERLINNKSKNEMEFLMVSNILYRDTFLNEIKSVTENHFENYFKNKKEKLKIEEDENILMIKKCFIEIMIYINKINKENFSSLIKNKSNYIMYNTKNIFQYLDYVKLLKYNEVSILDSDENKNEYLKSCLSLDLMEDADFVKEIFPQMINLLKYELDYNLTYDKIEKIIFFITYLQINITNVPLEYKCNNYSKLFIDIINDIQNLIKSLDNNILNQFYSKIREGNKLNLIISKYFYEIKSLEKYHTINYLFNKLSISHYIKNFSNCRKNFEITDSGAGLIQKEKGENIPDILKQYFLEIKNLVKTEKIMEKYTQKESFVVNYELENYILYKLYDKIYPINNSKIDEFIFNKCTRLAFIKPENIITDKKMINENLLLEAVNYINKINDKYTPIDKIKIFGKAFQILQNSMTFSSGKSDLGIDDTLPLLIYVIIKAKPDMIYTNYIFCKYFLNNELEKKEYGLLLMQIGMVIKIIANMKYTELKNVSEEEFGYDISIPEELKNDNKDEKKENKDYSEKINDNNNKG